MEFQDIFNEFYERRDNLKVLFVATSDETGQLNCAPKMLVDVIKPNKVFYIDFKYSQSYANMRQNWQTSLAFMDDKLFTGFRLNGYTQAMDAGREYLHLKEAWMRRVVSYEAARVIDRLKGFFSTHESEITIPDDFIIIKFVADEGSAVKPGRVLRAMRSTSRHSPKRIAGIQSRISELEKNEIRHLAAEHRLQSSKQFLQNVINGIADPVMVIDTKFKVVLANKTAMAGEPALTSKERLCYKMSHHCNSPCEGQACVLKEVLKTRNSATVVHEHCFQGKPIYAEVTGTPVFDKSGHVIQIVESCHDITHHRKLELALEEKSKYFEQRSLNDDLTGVYNRGGFVSLVEQQLKLAKRRGKPLFIIFSDIDSLKPINDRLGHAAGDRVLVESANLLKETFREADIIGRVGGDEFAVALIDCSPENVDLLTSRLKKKLAEKNDGSIAEIPFDMSFGVVSSSEQEAVEELLICADRLMYQQKHSKKQRQIQNQPTANPGTNP